MSKDLIDVLVPIPLLEQFTYKLPKEFQKKNLGTLLNAAVMLIFSYVPMQLVIVAIAWYLIYIQKL